MQAITTKYVGPTSYKGSRIIASSESGKRIIMHLHHELSSEENHCQAAIELCSRLAWKGTLQGGHTKDGMVWVFVDSQLRFTV